MRVLITGGAGYIGYSLVNQLEQNPEISEILVFDNLLRNNTHFFTEGKNLKKTKFSKGDILNIYDLQKVVKNLDLVIHLAAYVEAPYTYHDNYKYEQVNHYGTVVLFNALEKNPPKKLIFMSSAAVYGFVDNATESTQPMPANFYAASKQKAEEYLNLLKSKTEVIILRSANVFGYNPMVRLDSVINRFLFDAMVYERIKIHGRGNQLRPFISLETLVKNVENFIFSHEPTGIYNLVEFNQSMNQIRDFLMVQNPDLEFTYLNSNQEFKSLTMKSEKLNLEKDSEQILLKSYNEFQKMIRL